MKIIAASLIALLLLLQYDLWVGEGSLTAAWQLEDTLADQKQENDRLKLRNDTLAAEVQDLKSGLSAIEERARSELGMIKKDETFVQVVEDKN
jgi:cell division protein FtsB